MIFNKKRRWHCISGQPVTEMDKQVMYWENKGKLVPTRELIKTPEQIEGIRKSGVVNSGVLDEVAKQIHAGMSTEEIDKICYDYCTEKGAVRKGTKRRSSCVTRLYPENGGRHECPRQAYCHPQSGLSVATL